METPDGAGTVSSVNLLRQQVQVRLESDPDTPKCYHNCEVCVVRNGKGKRPEGYVQPPLEELVKLRRPPQKEEIPEPTRAPASPLAAALEAVFNGEVPQIEEQPPEQARPEEERRSRSRGRSRNRRGGERPKREGEEAIEKQKAERPPRQERSRPSKSPRGEEEPQPAAAQAKEGGEKRPVRRRRRPRGGGGKPQSGTQE